MTQENVEVVRRGVETWNRRDLATWLALFSSDAEIDWSRARGPLKGVYRGPGEIETLWNEFFFTFEEAQIEAHDFTDAGSQVVVSNTSHFRGREGIEVSASSTWVFTVENGQITSLRLFQERTEALEAAGLREYAMSQENVEVVRSIYEAFNRGDWDVVFRDLHPDFELMTPARGLDAGTFRGREEGQGYWEDFFTPYEAVTVEPEEFFERGDQLVVFVRGRLRPKGSSAEVEVQTGNLWTFRDGTAVSLRLFAEHEKALEAAGLRE